MTKTRQKKKSNNYFTSETDSYIVQYNLEEDSLKKSRIFENHLQYPFFKLTQNIIHTFKFYYLDVDTIEDLQHELLIYIISKLHLFNPNLGTKAYSYFGTAVKRWLINYNKSNYKKLVQRVDTTSIKDDIKFSYEIDNNQIENSKKIFDKYIEYCNENIYKYNLNDNQKQIYNSLIDIFKHRESLEILHKKAINIYVKEYINVKTNQITQIIKILKDLYKTFIIEFNIYK